jgi:hypothetical protein
VSTLIEYKLNMTEITDNFHTVTLMLLTANSRH